jgi:aminoglycoside phosphotransferase family enzyme
LPGCEYNQAPPPSGKDVTGLDAKVAFLRRPESYPESTRRVDVVETHMSWVFLTDAFAYKLKKPVRTPFLDFSSLALRRHFCAEEVRLNRRLAPRAYLETVALAEGPAGLSLGGAGQIVDWLVKMVRLPSGGTLDHAIRSGTVDKGDLDRLAAKLIGFYRTASPIRMSAEEYLLRFERDVSENMAALSEATGILPLPEVRRIHEAQVALLRKAGSPLAARALDGKIVEAHGDLRPEHVFLGPDPQIIDCLEFNRAFRCLDPIDELCFLAVECEQLGAPAVGTGILQEYCRATLDDPPQSLFDFYKCYRACLRAKLSFWHLREPKVRDPERWPRQTRSYLQLAGRYADQLPPS